MMGSHHRSTVTSTAHASLNPPGGQRNYGKSMTGSTGSMQSRGHVNKGQRPNQSHLVAAGRGINLLADVRPTNIFEIHTHARNDLVGRAAMLRGDTQSSNYVSRSGFIAVIPLATTPDPIC